MLELFWFRHPALLYGLSALLSLYYAWEGHFLTLALLILLTVTSISGQRRWIERMCCLWGVNLSVMIYAHLCCSLPEIPEEGITGLLHFHIDTIQTKESSFGRKKIYHGTAQKFWPSHAPETTLSRGSFPCTISLNEKSKQPCPTADHDSIIEGCLKKGLSGQYFFIPEKQKAWRAIRDSHSFAQTRFRIKEAVKVFLYEHVKDSRSAAFLSGIITGQFEDRMLAFNFRESGLLHLMAISGFHFSLIAGIFGLLLRCFFSMRTTAIVCAVFLTAYFLFLGKSPSVMRAWSMILIVLMGTFAKRKTLAMNALGASFLFMLAFDIFSLRSMGFQLSAAITAAILLFYPLTSEALKQLILSRPLSWMKNTSLFDQHCYCLLWSLRESLALMIAVNIIAIPMSLYYFGSFPWIGLVYNLFIPFFVGIALLGLILSAGCFFVIPSVGQAMFTAVSAFTRFTLNFVYEIPPAFRFSARAAWISGSLLAVYLAIVYTAGARQSLQERKGR